MERSILGPDALRVDSRGARGTLRESLAARYTGLAIFASALLLRLLMIAHENLWYDEAFTAWLVRLDLPRMMAAIAGDVHPPGWYLLEWVTTRLIGDSAFALRLPSALFGAWAAWLVWRIALSLGRSERVGALAGFLVAVLAGAVYYGQEARMYAALAAFVALMVLSAINQRWITMTLAGIAVVYLQNLGLVYVACILAAAFLRGLRDMRNDSEENVPSLYRDDVLSVPFFGLWIVAAWLLWLPTFIAQVRGVSSGFWMTPFTMPGFFLPLTTLSAGWRLADGFQLHAYFLVILFSALALYMSRSWLASDDGAILSAVAIGVPLVLAAISVLWRSVYLPRAILPAVILLMIPWAFALLEWPRRERRLVWALVLPMLAIGLIANYFPVQGRMDIERFTQPIRDNWQAGDIVYYTTNDAAILLTYYLPGKDWAIFPESSDLSQSLTDSTKAAMGFNPMSFDELPMADYRRAWVVIETGSLSSKAELDYQAAILHDHPFYIVAMNAGDPVYNVSIALIDLEAGHGES